MRPLALLAGFAILAAFATLAPSADARPSPACSDANGGTCPGVVCVDENLDGTFEHNECVIVYCPEYGCCGYGCPPPPYE